MGDGLAYVRRIDCRNDDFQQAAANAFKAIGDDFINMGTRMIAQALLMKAVGIFLPGGGATSSGGGLGGFGQILGGLAGGGPRRMADL